MALRIEEEDDLFIRMKQEEEYGKIINYSWYKLSENNDVSDALLLPCFKQMKPDCQFLSSQVAVGPFIFVIGGTGFRKHVGKMKRNVYYIDTRNPGNGWKKGPELPSFRAGGYPFVLGNTICLLGGELKHTLPYGLVLDLTTFKWKWFKSNLSCPIFPPMEIYVHGIIFNDSEDSDESIVYDYSNVSAKSCPKELFLHGSKDLYSYNFETAFWKVIEKPFRPIVNRTSATVNDVMYVFSDGLLMGYSMSKGKWFDVSLSGFDEYENTFPTRDEYDSWWTLPPCWLVHLGNDILCILWATPSLPPDNVVLHCTKFTVKFEMSEDGQLPAKVEESEDDELPVATVEVTLYRTYKLPPGIMVDCLTVSTSSTTTFPFME